MDNLQRKRLQTGTPGSIIRSWKVHRSQAPGGVWGWLGAIVAVICVMLVAVKVAIACTNAGSVTVTANMGAFSPNPVSVSSPATASLPAGYTPPSGVSEGDLSAKYDWTVTLVQYKHLQADSFGTAQSGSYIAPIPIVPKQPSSSGTATLTFTPLVAGYWRIYTSCTVSVTDAKTNQCWSGTANAAPQTLTSATVSFSPNPIETGADKSQQNAIFVKVTATVTPKDLVSNVSVNNFVTLPGGAGAAGVDNSQPDTSTGQIVFDLYGINGTAPSMPTGDVKLEAKDGGTVLGTVIVTIEITKAIGTPHPTFGPKAVTPAHYVLTSTSTPAGFGLQQGYEYLATDALDWMTIPVIDQFGKPLSSVYKGAPVDEEEGSSWDPINQTMSANGTYQDPVSVGNLSQSVPLGNPNNVPWPTLTSPQGPYLQNISVEVAGFPLNPGVVNRSVSYANGMLTITWP